LAPARADAVFILGGKKWQSIARERLRAHVVRWAEVLRVEEKRGPLPKVRGFQQRAPRFSPRGGGASVGANANNGADQVMFRMGTKEKLHPRSVATSIDV